MKFKKMDTVTKLRTMGRVTPVLARIGEDPAVTEALQAITGRDKEAGESRLQQWSFILGAVGPAILERHAEDVCEIVSIMTGKPIEKVKEPGNDIISDLKDFLDEDFLGFFTQSSRSGPKTS